jgi:biopolymer transport protein ExbB
MDCFLAQMNYFRVFIYPGGGVIGGILWLLSFFTLGLIIYYFITIRVTTLLPDPMLGQVRELFDQKQYREAIEVTENQPDYFSYILHAALGEAAHGYGAMERAMEEAAEEKTAKLLRNIEWLNLVGNIAPMMGLLGTVWGMIQAFFDIVAAGGSPKPGDLAQSIGVALVTTMLGLSIAIPSLAAYAFMRNRVDSLTTEGMIQAQDLISTFRPAKK